MLIPRTVRAWASWFGDLRGLTNLTPSRRLEVSPYVAGAATRYPETAAGNPFTDGANMVGRVGADVKMGLGPNLTLEATINPDFGQVEADPAEVNLTAFETRFPERRPFFLEGAPLFNIGHPNFYYSRRIGARPVGVATGDYVDYPTATTILTAAKLSGRLPSRTSIAFLTAATAEEEAEVAFAQTPGTQEIAVAPRAYYGVGRVLQEFGSLGSTAGVFASAVHRSVDAGSPLANLHPENAAALAGNTLLRFRGGEYEFRAAGGVSVVNGAEAAIERVQRSSAHFAQRPDRTYSPLDPTLRSLGGTTLQLNIDRVSGRHWLWGANTKLDSENFETNDLAQPERRRRLAEQRQPPLPRDPARPGPAQLRAEGRRQHRHDAASAGAGRLRARHGDGDLGQLLDLVDRGAPRSAADQRVADPRRPADGPRARLDHGAQRRQPHHRRDALDGGADLEPQRRRPGERSGQRLAVGASRAALAADGRAVLRPHHRAAAVRRARWPAAGRRPTTRATSSPSSIAPPWRRRSGSGSPSGPT